MRRRVELFLRHIHAHHLPRREAHDVLIVVLLTPIMQRALYAVFQPQRIDAITESDVVGYLRSFRQVYHAH